MVQVQFVILEGDIENMINTTNIFDYEDVQLIPNKCIVTSRSECDTHVKLGNRTFPLASSSCKYANYYRRRIGRKISS